MGPYAQAGVQAAGNVLDSIVGLFTQKSRDKRQLEHSKELQKYAFDKNMEAWRIQNAYNTPAAQMERFKEAGLNPNLIYGKGTPGLASELPKYQAPRPNYKYQVAPVMQGLLSNYNVSRKTDAEVDLARENRDYIEQRKLSEGVNRALTGANILKVSADTKGKRILNKYQDDILKTQLAETRTKIAESASNTQLNYARKELVKLQSESERLKPSQIRATIRQIQANTSLSRKQIEKVNQEVLNLMQSRRNLKLAFKRGGVDLQKAEIETLIRQIEQGWLLNKGIRPQDNWISKEIRSMSYDIGKALRRTYDKTKRSFKRDLRR